MTSKNFLPLIKLTVCFCGMIFLAGCSSSTNEQVVVPETSLKFSDVHEDYQGLKERLGIDENFESTRSK